jgi:hypothetical protein
MRGTTWTFIYNGLHFFCVVRTVHFGMKFYNDQSNAQVLNFIYLFTSALHVSSFLLAHLQRQVYNFSSGSSLRASPGADTIPKKLEPLPKLYTCL